MFKKIRFTTQLLFFLITLFIIYGYLDNDFVVDFYHSLHIYQNLSSLAWFIIPPFFFVSLFVLFHAMFAGRIYCSFLCPVGFIQDLVGMFSSQIKIKRKALNYKLIYPAIFFFSTVFLLVFRSSWYGVIDHYSNLGRLAGLINFQMTFSTLLAVIFFSLIVVVTLFRPRFFCHTVCPSGTLFTFFQKRAFYRIGISKEACGGCKRCERKCPTMAIRETSIDKNSCINCFECFDVCPDSAFEFNFNRPFKRKSIEKTERRREFIKSIPFAAIGGTVGAIAILQREPAKLKSVIPPGSKASNFYLKKCTMCSTCVSVCPTNVLRPAGYENGLIGVGRPVMNYETTYCSYECNICLSVCPTGALTYVPLKQKQQIKMGASKIDEKTCIPFDKKRDCSSCAEHCPTGAVEMHLEDDMMVPKVDDDYCIGCGICHDACPVIPIKSITIVPKSIHTIAYDAKKKKRPSAESPAARIESETNDFPF